MSFKCIIHNSFVYDIFHCVCFGFGWLIVIMIVLMSMQVLSEVRADSSEVTWLLAYFENSNIKSPLKMLASGSGDTNELSSHLEYDQAAYGIYRTTDVIDDITTVKFVYIIW